MFDICYVLKAMKQMISLLLRTIVPLVIGVALPFRPASAGADTFSTCKTIADKMWLGYTVQMSANRGAKRPPTEVSIEHAETIVAGVYQMSRSELEAVQPGVYDWSIASLITAGRIKQSPEDFKKSLFVECLSVLR